jgi:hypothetical protein
LAHQGTQAEGRPPACKQASEHASMHVLSNGNPSVASSPCDTCIGERANQMGSLPSVLQNIQPDAPNAVDDMPAVRTPT